MRINALSDSFCDSVSKTVIKIIYLFYTRRPEHPVAPLDSAQPCLRLHGNNTQWVFVVISSLIPNLNQIYETMTSGNEFEQNTINANRLTEIEFNR